MTQTQPNSLSIWLSDISSCLCILNEMSPIIGYHRNQEIGLKINCFWSYAIENKDDNSRSWLQYGQTGNHIGTIQWACVIFLKMGKIELWGPYRRAFKVVGLIDWFPNNTTLTFGKWMRQCSRVELQHLTEERSRLIIWLLKLRHGFRRYHHAAFEHKFESYCCVQQFFSIVSEIV